ncbi:serine O-acetyltransferase [Flagellimonas zhangzhouensis]|uniref:Serine O-acetyltransferase n=2 Tax=Flagellimonas zhangzhouensis TaxID=1073328 RepID=A0A1H2YRW5_9FLAO|nr:serine O-acetyltransferase [Allomuricauda zhangzhouensis]SDX07538.1 serine O-acetyltransferase [Allomuricauda zhangzhouensis]
MIKSREDYLRYLKEDMVARGESNQSLKAKIKKYLSPTPTWVFQKKLRKYEYFLNVKKGPISKIRLFFINRSFRKISQKLNYTIPPNVFGPGLCILHYGTIVVNSKSKIGKNCRIEVCVNIGASAGKPEAPIIGDNVYIGPGAKIYGNIILGNNIAIAANSSVNKSFEENNILIAGSPAKRIKEFDISTIIKHLKY